jgi:putative phosphoesterase
LLRIGLISDTHDLLRPQAVSFLRGCDHIVHAGDVTGPAVLGGLAELAPVTAVRGNNDKGAWASRLRETELITFEAISVYVLHDVGQLDTDPIAAGIHVVVFGHSHKPSVAERGGVLFINPGSAGPRRFKLPVSVGELIVSGGKVSGRTVELVVER